MYFGLFVGAALLTCCTGESSKKVVALAGTATVLRCSFNNSDDNEFPTVEWSKVGPEPNVVFLYRDGCETHEMKDPAFEFRTSFFAKELKHGNVSLRISNVQLTDAGTYRCKRLWSKAPPDITEVELAVDVVSEPKLSFSSLASGQVTLQCEAGCWLPVPQVEFLDDKGNVISADHPKQDSDASGCFSVTRNVTLQDATNRVTCRVHQQETNRTRTTHILIPVDYMTSCSLTNGIVIGGTISIILVICGFVALKQWGKCGGKCRLQSSGHSRKSSVSENETNPIIVNMDNMGNTTIENLMERVAELKSEIAEKDKTIRQLENNNRSLQSHAVSHHNGSTVVQRRSQCSLDAPRPSSPPSDRDVKPCPTSVRVRLHSSPAALDRSSSLSIPKKDGVNRALRRQSSIPPKASDDPTLLALLSEESE